MAIELQDKLYTSAQVADVLGVSLRTLYRYMEDGRIESMKTASGRHRFTKEQILTFLDGGGFDQDLEAGSMPRASTQRDQGRDSGRDIYDPAPVRNQSNNDFSFYSNKDREDRTAARPAAPVASASRSNYDMDFNDPYERNRDRVEPAVRQQPQSTSNTSARKDPYADLDMDGEDDFDDSISLWKRMILKTQNLVLLSLLSLDLGSMHLLLEMTHIGQKCLLSLEPICLAGL